MKIFRTVLAGLATAATIAAHAQGGAPAWPVIRLPDGAQEQTIATDMTLNGRATRLYRFEANDSEKALRDFFFAQFGPRTVEGRLKQGLTIGTRQGDFFVTVQLHAADQVQRGTVMVTHMSGPALGSAASMDTQRWLPANSQVISTVQSTDAGRRSLTLIAVNQFGVLANRDALVTAMKTAGFQVRSAEANERRAVVQLVSNQEDAQLIVSDNGSNRSVVLTRMSQMR